MLGRLPDGRDADPTVGPGPKPSEADHIRQAVFYATYSTCDSWHPIYMLRGGQEYLGYRGGIVRVDKRIVGRFNISMGEVQIAGDAAKVSFSDFCASQGAASYRATLKKIKGTWVVTGVAIWVIA